MKRIQKRMLLQVIMGYLLGRVSIFGLNPIGIAYFAAGFAKGGAVLPVGIAVFFGMMGSMRIETALCGGMVMVSLGLVADILNTRDIHIKMGHAALISAASSAALWIFQIYMMPYSEYDVWYAVLGSVLIIAFTRIFDDGVHFVLYANKKSEFSNEELISVVIMTALAIWGLPKFVYDGVSFMQVVIYLLLLLAGWCYGAGTGAVAGVAAGILFYLCGEPAEMVGVMSLLGICAGMFRKYGKLFTVSVFLSLAVALHYTLDGDIAMGMVKTVCAAQIVFLCIPGKLLRNFREQYPTCQKNEQEIVKRRITDFSQAFDKLSAAILEQSERYAPLEYSVPVELAAADGAELTAVSELGFQNRVMEGRRIMACQLRQVSDMMLDLADNMQAANEFSDKMEEQIITALKGKRVIAEDIYAYEKRDGRLKVVMSARTTRGRLVTSSEMARVLSGIVNKAMCPADESRKVIANEMTQYVFEEDTPLYAITGVATTAKNGENISGDTFSCISLPEGEMLLALSDGMGSGKKAMEESRSLIELLEDMTEAGISHELAIRLINALYMSDRQTEGYATADIVLLNLFQGKCNFLKNGAAATYLKHHKKVKRIEGQTLPIGILHEVDSYEGEADILAGDYVIMVTDGVCDSFGDEETFYEYIRKCNKIDPQEFADSVLGEAVRRCDGSARDDMSIIIAGIWERNKIS